MVGTLLDGFRVLELSRDVSAAYCARQFALWGAEVVVVEPDEGSPIRRRGPFARTADGRKRSLTWEYVAAGKRSLRASDLGNERLAELAAACDVLVTDLGQAELAAMGLDPATLRRARPDLVVTEVSGFGRDGPYAGFKGGELIVQALSGYLSLNGMREGPPLPAPGHLVGYAVGVNAFVGALAALFKVQRTGCGARVEVTGIETLAAFVPFLRVQYMGRDKVREGGTEAGVRILPCADGWVSLLTVNPAQKRLLGEILEIPADAWPADLYAGTYHQIVVKTVAFLSGYTRRKTMEQVFQALAAHGVVCGKVNGPLNLLESDQLEARGFFQALDHPELGKIALAGSAARLTNATTAEPRAAPAGPESPPDIGWTPRPRRAPSVDDSALPLAGLRVLDLTQAWIGPFATLIFADLGAEVVKIESHKRPDVWRSASPNPVALAEIKAEKVNRSHYFNSVNRNKRNLALDLRSEAGKAIFRRLAVEADVVAENYTPQVMGKFGLDYEALIRIKPDLVMASFSGFGKTGPLSDFKSNGSAIEAMAGWDWLHRYPRGEPVLMGFYQADPICGLQMAALTLAALIRRERTGHGENIDGAMMDASVGYIGDILLQQQLCGPVEPAVGRDSDLVPSGVYPARGKDRWIAIAVSDDAAWQVLARQVGGALADPRFTSFDGRRQAPDEIDAALRAWTVGFEADDLMRKLQAAGVPAGVVRSAAEALDEPHLAARDWFKVMTHADLGAHKYNGFPWRFEGCELQAHTPPPRLGEHSEILLRELLGLGDDEIASLKAKDVTGAVL